MPPQNKQDGTDFLIVTGTGGEPGVCVMMKGLDANVNGAMSAAKTFERDLKELVCRSLFDIKCEGPEAKVAMITALAMQLGFCSALLCDGDQAAMGKLLDGMTHFIFETAGRHQRTAQIMDSFQWKGPGRFPGDTGGEAA